VKANAWRNGHFMQTTFALPTQSFDLTKIKILLL